MVTTERKLDILQHFVDLKSKLVTDRKVKIAVYNGGKNITRDKYGAFIIPIGNIKSGKYSFIIYMNDKYFSMNDPMERLKTVILHELAHIPDLVKKNGDVWKKNIKWHTGEFKKACNKLGVNKSFAKSRAPKRK